MDEPGSVAKLRAWTTPRPFTPITATTTFSFADLRAPTSGAIPRDVAEKWGDDFSRHVIGSGAFMLKEWIGGQRLVLVRNPFYFAKPLPHQHAAAIVQQGRVGWRDRERGIISGKCFFRPVHAAERVSAIVEGR